MGSAPSCPKAKKWLKNMEQKFGQHPVLPEDENVADQSAMPLTVQYWLVVAVVAPCVCALQGLSHCRV